MTRAVGFLMIAITLWASPAAGIGQAPDGRVWTVDDIRRLLKAKTPDEVVASEVARHKGVVTQQELNQLKKEGLEPKAAAALAGWVKDRDVPPLKRPVEPKGIPTRERVKEASRTSEPVPATPQVQATERAVQPPPNTTKKAAIVGCWSANGAPGLDFRQDGTFASGRMAGKWTLLDQARSEYLMEFPDESGFGELSEDGKQLSLTGIMTSTLSRSAGGLNPVGEWRFAEGATFSIRADATFNVGRITGRWRALDPGRRSLILTWPGHRLVATIAPDGQSGQAIEASYMYNIQMRPITCVP